MLSDSLFKSYRDNVNTIDNDINATLFIAYSTVDKDGLSTFNSIWSVWVQLSGITPKDRQTIAEVAASYNLPMDFINVIKG